MLVDIYFSPAMVVPKMQINPGTRHIITKHVLCVVNGEDCDPAYQNLFMPPTLKKLEGHIGLGLSVCVCVCNAFFFEW